MSLVLLLLAIAIALVLIMAAAWGLILKTGKSGWADTFWSAGIGLVGCVAVLASLETPMVRPLIVAALLAIWSLRLATHIGRRTLKGEDDPRYAQLRKDWGESYRSRLFGFLQIQAVAAFVLVGAALAAAHNPAPLGWTDGLGVAIAIAAMVGEAIERCPACWLQGQSGE